MIAVAYLDHAEAWLRVNFSKDHYAYIREMWGKHITDEMIDAAIAFEADPDHRRITLNARRRQRYAEMKWRPPGIRAEDVGL